MTEVAAESITSWSPDTWQVLLGEHPTVTRTRAAESNRGSTIVFAPTCRLGACHPPSTVVRCGALLTTGGVAAGAGRWVGAGVAGGRGARVARDVARGVDGEETGAGVDGVVDANGDS